MTARYLVRLDDACPTMDRERWDAIEALLDEFSIMPVVAVVPENLDADLIRSAPDPTFWERVKRWEAKGWAIAMHGLHHLYHAVDRKSLIVPFHDRSEFGGLDYASQAALIARSWASFEARGIRPSVWIAPGHAFDRVTVAALKNETPIRIISDGLSLAPFCEDGFIWVPQQLWRPEARLWGVWTICLHPNTMDDADISRLRTTLSEPFYRNRLIGLSGVTASRRRKGIFDRLYRPYFFARNRAISALLPLYQAGKRLKMSRAGP